jgi:hypothetical protein
MQPLTTREKVDGRLAQAKSQMPSLSPQQIARGVGLTSGNRHRTTLESRTRLPGGSRGSVPVAERLVAGTACEATPGDRAERFQGDRSQPAAGRA